MKKRENYLIIAGVTGSCLILAVLQVLFRNALLQCILTTVLFGTVIGIIFRKSHSNDKYIHSIIMFGMLLRSYVIIAADWSRYQNDVGQASIDSRGHLGYIYYICMNNFKIPDFDIRSLDSDILSQFYHPPLHHYIEAIWMKINLTLKVPFGIMQENLQILPLIYFNSDRSNIKETEVYMEGKNSMYSANILFPVFDNDIRRPE